ncbi:MAG TPA: PilZ domain-containing protein [Candidatus Acidoferrum sp.]|nr:PilZ domain-containing protein [Candidatus Acidoferrum sp.]
MTLRNIILERREKTRKVPEQFAFLQLEQDDGGTVLDISEGGLRFETFDQVKEHGPIHFWFSLNLRERIEAWGELAWVDAARKTGGLKFLSLSEGGREQIHEYLGYSSPQKFGPKPAAHEGDAVATFVSRARPRESTLFPNRKEKADPAVAFPRPNLEAASSGVLVPMQRHLAAMRRQLMIGLAIGACAAAIIVFIAIKFSQFLHDNRATAKPTVEAPAQTAPALGPTSNAPQATGQTGTDVFAIGNQRKAGGTTRTQAAPPSLPIDPVARTSRQKTPLTPDQLWTMVQAGNSTAAAALAELYIKGDGVPQSCAQARVLLLVASEKRNAGAIKRLADLDKEGCPAN